MAITAEPKMVPVTDTNGVPLSGAKLYYFVAGTTTPKTVYANEGLSVAHDYPMEADAYGRFDQVFIGEGAYKIRVTTAAGSVVYEYDNLPGAPAAAEEEAATVTGFETGDVKVRLDDQVLSGWVRFNGKTIGNAASGATERANADTEALFLHLWERDTSHNLFAISGGRGLTAAADYAAAKTLTLPNAEGRALMGLGNMGLGTGSPARLSTTITTTSTSTSATVASATGLYAGMYIDSENVPAGTVINSISGTAIVMSSAASGSAAGTAAHFSPFRAYDWLGASAGSIYSTLIAANLASHNHTGTTSAVNDHTHTGASSTIPDHTHGFTGTLVADHTHTTSGSTTTIVQGAGGAVDVLVPNATNTGLAGAHTPAGTIAAAGSHTPTITIGAAGTHSHTFTTDVQGTSQPFNSLSPGVLVGVYIKL